MSGFLSARSRDIEIAGGSDSEAGRIDFCAGAGHCAGKLRPAVFAGIGLVAGALLVYFVTPPAVAGHGGSLAKSSATEVVGLQGTMPASAASIPAGASMPPPMPPVLDAYFRQMMGVPGSASPSAGVKSECAENEELFQGLCYKKCELLTNGTFHLRTSAWTCCQAVTIEDCFVSNQDKDLGMCSGYDVSGDGKSCPHLPGKCLENEEKFLGSCFEKCSILTGGKKPFRTSPFSCCETSMALGCFNPKNILVSGTINTGGGKGDGDASTPSAAHTPLPSNANTVDAPVAN